MKVNVLQQYLKAALSIALRGVGSKTTLPVLNNVLLRARDGKFTISSTNLEIGIVTECVAVVEQDGETTIPAKMLADVIGGMANDRISLVLDDKTQTLAVTCGRDKANIKGIEADEYPIIPTPSGDVVRFPTAFTSAIHRVAYAAATDDTRPVLTAVLLRVRDGIVTLAAADGFRLASQTFETESQANIDLLIPAKSLLTLAAILGDDDVEMTYSANAGQVRFSAGGVSLVTRLIEGKFPDFERIIPQRVVANERMIETSAILRALRLAAPFAAQSANICKIDAGDKVVTLSANSAEVGNNTSAFDCTGCADPVQTAANLVFLRAAIENTGADKISLSLTTPQSPLVVRADGDDNYVAIVMPMQTR